MSHLHWHRGYCHFEQPGRAFDDWSAALNHVEIKHDPRPWYSAVHNLTIFTVEHGTEEQIRVARANLGPAQRRLKTVWSRKTRKFARLKMRWVMALLDSRLGAESHAELELLDVRDAFVDLGFPCEIGWLSTDLARLYLTLGRHHDLTTLLGTTDAIFRDLNCEELAKEALDLWRNAATIDDDLLKRVRKRFYMQAKPIPGPAPVRWTVYRLGIQT